MQNKFTHEILNILLNNNQAAKSLLFTNTMQAAQHNDIFGNLDQAVSFELFEDRLLLLKKLCLFDESNNLSLPFRDIHSLDFIWNYLLAIVQKILQLPNMICGIAGAPGSGKSTLANAILKCIAIDSPTTKTLAISLDDFYLSKAERKMGSIQWRAQPGSHNIKQITSFLDAVRGKKNEIIVPHFDHAIDDCAPSEIKNGPIDILIFEGWFVGMHDMGYEKIASQLDYLIYLDCSAEFSKIRRFSREEKTRSQSENLKGMPLNELNHFWDEVLYPGISKWVLPVKSKANLVINIEDHG